MSSTIGARTLVEAATVYATKAAQFPRPAVFCPPIATFTSAKRAREIDLANGLALSVECDAHPSARAQLLEQLLGPATVVVASGGVWTDPETQEPHEKLHLHWRLDEPTSDAEEHARSSARGSSRRGSPAATRPTRRRCTRSAGPAAGTGRAYPARAHRGARRRARARARDALEQLEAAAAATAAGAARGARARCRSPRRVSRPVELVRSS
jgi:hypothetical protein